MNHRLALKLIRRSNARPVLGERFSVQYFKFVSQRNYHRKGQDR